ncbi:MAG: TlpA disulfide reductase family protein, partial [Miltoncostaeaceae bacterium]
AIAIGLAQRDSTPLAVAPVTPIGQRPLAADIELPVFQAGDGIGPEGSTLALADLRGRVVVVNLWAYWCGPCREEVPELQDLADAYDPGRVLVLGLNSEDVEGDARRFLADYPFDYPSVRDPGSDSARALEILGYPSTLIIDTQGRVATRFSGAIEDERQLVPAVDQVLGEG